MPMKKPISGMYRLRYCSIYFRISEAFERVTFVRLFSLEAGMKSPATFALSCRIRKRS
jgi:hypothetical protein